MMIVQTSRMDDHLDCMLEYWPSTPSFFASRLLYNMLMLSDELALSSCFLRLGLASRAFMFCLFSTRPEMAVEEEDDSRDIVGGLSRR